MLESGNDIFLSLYSEIIKKLNSYKITPKFRKNELPLKASFSIASLNEKMQMSFRATTKGWQFYRYDPLTLMENNGLLFSRPFSEDVGKYLDCYADIVLKAKYSDSLGFVAIALREIRNFLKKRKYDSLDLQVELVALCNYRHTFLRLIQGDDVVFIDPLLGRVFVDEKSYFEIYHRMLRSHLEFFEEIDKEKETYRIVRNAEDDYLYQPFFIYHHKLQETPLAPPTPASASGAISESEEELSGVPECRGSTSPLMMGHGVYSPLPETSSSYSADESKGASGSKRSAPESEEELGGMPECREPTSRSMMRYRINSPLPETPPSRSADESKGTSGSTRSNSPPARPKANSAPPPPNGLPIEPDCDPTPLTPLIFS